jgi:hypothetical protein
MNIADLRRQRDWHAAQGNHADALMLNNRIIALKGVTPMSYDNWKATNPGYEFLGPEPVRNISDTLPHSSHGSRLLLEPVDLADTLSAVKHRNLNLSAEGKNGGNRPSISIWPAADEDMPPAVVTVAIHAMYGQQSRYIDLTPDEALTLARYLIETAKLIERETETVS